jgi:hypothetical protein
MSSEPMTGEIWEDGEGTLMCNVGPDEWMVMGSCDIIPTDHYMVVHPLRLAFDVFGQCAITSLRYPNGFCYGVPAGRNHERGEDDE